MVRILKIKNSNDQGAAAQLNQNIIRSFTVRLISYIRIYNAVMFEGEKRFAKEMALYLLGKLYKQFRDHPVLSDPEVIKFQNDAGQKHSKTIPEGYDSIARIYT